MVYVDKTDKVNLQNYISSRLLRPHWSLQASTDAMKCNFATLPGTAAHIFVWGRGGGGVV